mgnify:CR=1 FL=1
MGMTPRQDADNGDAGTAVIVAVRSLRIVGVQEGYREAVAALAALESMSWFDSFDEIVYRERMTAVYYIQDAYPSVSDEYAELVDEARDVVEGTA